jgi:hypothetical protein
MKKMTRFGPPPLLIEGAAEAKFGRKAELTPAANPWRMFLRLIIEKSFEGSFNSILG